MTVMPWLMRGRSRATPARGRSPGTWRGAAGVSIPCLVALAVWPMACGASEGWVRVIVRFRVAEPTTPTAIHAARDAILQQIAQAPHRVVRQFETLPLLVLEVSPEALGALRAAPGVVSIQPDTLSAPQPISPRPPSTPPPPR